MSLGMQSALVEQSVSKLFLQPGVQCLDAKIFFPKDFCKPKWPSFQTRIHTGLVGDLPELVWATGTVPISLVSCIFLPSSVSPFPFLKKSSSKITREVKEDMHVVD